MKILYLTLSNGDVNNLPEWMLSDYMSDLLFHGLRSLYGEAVVDVPKKGHMYKDWGGKVSELWGRGFSYSKLLDDIEVDRSDVNRKIYKEFDVIVLSVHHSIHTNPNQLYQTLEQLHCNTKAKIVVVDGHDTTVGYDFAPDYTPWVFKREIVDDNSRFLPISFAIPAEKIRDSIAPKTKMLASILPADHTHSNRKTHIFNTEGEYYNDYAESYFGLTCKKGGWNCLRHYEIMANGCVPIFTDIELCPQPTMTDLPKQLFSDVKKLKGILLKKITFTKDEIYPGCVEFDEELLDKEMLYDLCQKQLDYTRKNLTTERLAEYLMEKIK